MTKIPPKQHSSRFVELAQNAQSRIKEITPAELKQMLEEHSGCYVIDVREESELPVGVIPEAIHLSKGVIERDIEKHIADHNAKIIVYCSGGYRSALVADNLQKMGFTNVYSLTGGLRAWLDAGNVLAKWTY